MWATAFHADYFGPVTLSRIIVVRDAFYQWHVPLVFDGQCYFCMRSLYLFRILDINDTVRFIPQAEAPDAYRQRGDVDFRSAVYAFDGTTANAGYDAFRELLRQFRVFVPLVWLMGLAPIARVGTRVYR